MPNLIRNISTFKELDEYINTIISVLDIIDSNSTNPYFSQYNHTFQIVKKTYGVDGYALTLMYHDTEIASIGYYRLDMGDGSWGKCYASGHTHIYGFPETDYGCYDYNSMEDGSVVQEIPYSLDDYNEEMYNQLEFIYPIEQLNIAMCLAKLSKSDSNREYRQFVIYEYPALSFSTVITEINEFIKMHDLLKRWHDLKGGMND